MRRRVREVCQSPENVGSVLVTGGKEALRLCVEPEGMSYDLPKKSKVLLTFRGPHAMKFELSYDHDWVTVWRPSDKKAWAATMSEQEPR
jgi:hypothetical protein